MYFSFVARPVRMVICAVRNHSDNQREIKVIILAKTGSSEGKHLPINRGSSSYSVGTSTERCVSTDPVENEFDLVRNFCRVAMRSRSSR